MSVKIPVPAAELFDKVSILSIKKERTSDKEKLENVVKELKSLEEERNNIYKTLDPDKTKELAKEEILLRHSNELLWDIEDAIRTCETFSKFEEFFILLARMVYLANDERSRIKKRINRLLGSSLTEEKHFSHKKML